MVVLDTREFEAKLRDLASIMRHASRRAVEEAGTRLFLDCYEVPPTVPYRTGRLRSSGSLHVDGKRVMTGATLGYRFGNAAPDDPASVVPGGHAAVVRFDAPYAALVHEAFNVRFQHPGSGPKFLESKVRNWPRYLEIIRRYLAGVLR